MTELIRVPSKRFYKLLDKIANNEKTTRDYFDEALTLARREKFTDLEIALLMKDYLKDKIPKTTLHRWTKALEPTEEETDTEIDESTSQSVPLEQIDENKDLEETPVETPTEPKENPLQIENDFLREENANLKDAMSKMQQFTPANKLTEEQARNMTMEAVKQAGMATPIILTEEMVFDWLAKREDKVSRYWFPNYGIELFRTRILSDLNNRGVKMFKRLYFEV